MSPTPLGRGGRGEKDEDEKRSPSANLGLKDSREKKSPSRSRSRRAIGKGGAPRGLQMNQGSAIGKLGKARTLERLPWEKGLQWSGKKFEAKFGEGGAYTAWGKKNKKD